AQRGRDRIDPRRGARPDSAATGPGTALHPHSPGERMLTIAIVCGAGIATSALIAEQVRDHIASRGREAHVVQATVMDLLSPDFRADLVISTVDLPDALGVPQVSGMPLLLGTNPQVTYDDIDRLLARIGADGGAPEGEQR